MDRLIGSLAAGLCCVGCGILIAPVPAPKELLVEGQAGCVSSLECAEGLYCVPRVGAEYGFAPTANVCERATLPYGFLTTGTRASRELTRDALGGVFRLPRSLEVAIPTTEYVGTRKGGGKGCASGGQPACQLPDWALLWGKNADGELALPSKYDRFTLFGFRFLNQFFDVLHRREDRVIEAEIGPAHATREQVEQLLFALFDSFSLSAGAPFALAEDPAPDDRNIGYQNPNRLWAPALGQWDPAQNVRNQDGPGAQVPDAPGLTYVDLRDSLWDRHGTAFRAMQFAGAFRQFRGLLDDEGRARWMGVLRETGLALALPSSFEGTSNHGVSEAVALLVLSVHLRGTDTPLDLLDAWQVLGTHRLNQVLANTLYAGDGVQRERSAFYHNYQLGLLVEVRDWLRQNQLSLTDVTPNRDRPALEKIDFDPTLAPEAQSLTPGDADARLDADNTVNAMMDFAAAVTLPNGDVPMIGAGPYSSLRTYQHSVFESLFDDPSPEAQRLAYVVSGGEQGSLPAYGARIFADSGFVVLRSPSDSGPENDAHVVFQAGFPAHSKAHPDALSLHVYGPDSTQGRGRVLLGDSGWFSYRRPERHYFESTLAHNTVTIARESQCMDETTDRTLAPGSELGLRNCAEVRARAVASAGAPDDPAGAVRIGLTEAGSGWTYQSAIHGLYPGVTHARGVVLGSAGWLIVLDDVTAVEDAGVPAREAELYWHLGQGLQAQAPAPGQTYRFGTGGEETLVSLDIRAAGEAGDAPATCSVVEGSCADAACTVPLQGFVSPAEDEMLAAPVVECTSAGAHRVTWATLISLEPTSGRAALTRVERLPGADHTPGQEELHVRFEVDGRPRSIVVTAMGRPSESVRVED
jgi:hypothetical protein